MTFTGIASEGLGASLQKLQSSFSHQTSRKVGEEGIKKKNPKINHSDYSEGCWGRSAVRKPLLKLRMLRELLSPGVLVARLTTQFPVPIPAGDGHSGAVRACSGTATLQPPQRRGIFTPPQKSVLPTTPSPREDGEGLWGSRGAWTAGCSGCTSPKPRASPRGAWQKHS